MTDEDRDLIDRIDRASGQTVAAVDGMAKMYRALLGAIPDVNIEQLVTAINGVEPAVRRVIAAVYATHHTTTELRELAEWYESPLAVRMRDRAPVIQDSIALALGPILRRAIEAIP